MKDVHRLIEWLELAPHPIEGGYFRETYRAAGSLPPEQLPTLYQARTPRSLGTAIYYLLTPHTFSELHRLPTDEIFHLYLGGPVQMLHLLPDGSSRRLTIGIDLARGERPQVVVPANVWQGSWIEPGVGFALLGCTMAPGFDLADYDQGRRGDLKEQYPGEAALIDRLTRV